LKQNLESLIDNFFLTEETKKINLEKIILLEFEKYQKKLSEQSSGQKEILDHIKNSIEKIDKEENGIVSISPSNKSDTAIVVRFENKDDIEKGRNIIKKAVKKDGLKLTDELAQKYDSSIEVTAVETGVDRVYIVYKYDIGSREGLALEHVVAFLLTKKVTDQLKDRLNLSPDADKEQVVDALKTSFKDVLMVGLKGKKLIEQKIGKVVKAESVGSVNSKADLILMTESGKKYGLSIKLVTEEGRGVRFTYNKNLGYGDEKDDNLVKNPSGKPWWLVGRQILAKKLGKSYSPKQDDFEPPSWMVKEKENKTDAYKESMEKVYEMVREVYVNNLRNLKFKELVAIVNEAQQGSQEEQSDYEQLLVLASDADGIRLEENGASKPDIQKIKDSGMTKKDLVKTEGANIIIEIPGLSPLTIHGLKFHNNMLSSKRDDLKIKTR
jgi:hypothetical protein